MGKVTISVDVTRDGENQISGGTVTIFTRDFEIVGIVDVEGGTISWGEIESNVPGIKGVPGSLTLDAGSTYTISATLKGISGTISWSNGGSTIVTVSNSGVVSVDGNAANGATATITASADGGESKQCVITVRKVVVPQVGQVVNYEPSGTYNWDKNYATSDNTTTGDDAIDILCSASGQTYNVTQWKILSYDPNTKMVEMVPTTPKGSLRLQGAQGYNNAVKMLDDACSSLYSTGSTITARSIKEEDFVKAGKLSLDGDNSTTNDWTRMRDTWSSGYATYGNTLANAYSNGYSWYPNIHALEEQNGLNNGATMGLSEQTGNLIERKIKDVENTKFKPSSGGIKPVQTYYNSSNYTTTVSKLDSTKARVLLPNSSSTNYWVASRCVRAFWSDCGFRVDSVESGYFGADDMFYCYDRNCEKSRALYPVVSLRSELLEFLETTNTWNVNLN